MKENKISRLQCYLTVVSVCCLLISNIITAKQMVLPFGITMTCAVMVFPITYILSDVFSEVYGYKWSRISCYLGFAMNLVMVGFFAASIATKAPSYWGNQEAFETVLGNTPRVLFASLTAFLVGDFVNDKVFDKLKRRDGDNRFGVRAILSSLCGELCDSLIFVPVAFYGQMPVKSMLTMICVQPLLKVLYELLILPVTATVVRIVKAHEMQNG